MALLVPHTDHPARAIDKVEAWVSCDASIWQVDYRVQGDIGNMTLPPVSTPCRQDGLWRSSCFEMFAATRGKSYREFNFSPSHCYAAYLFDDYRAGQRDAAATVAIETHEEADNYRLVARLGANLGDAAMLALTAVIEEKDGTKSYWALAHPASAPDFHDPAGFLLPIEDIR